LGLDDLRRRHELPGVAVSVLGAVKQQTENVGWESGAANRPREHEVRIASGPEHLHGRVDCGLRGGNEHRSRIRGLAGHSLGAEVRALVGIEL
jgi:hypothetical protein